MAVFYGQISFAISERLYHTSFKLNMISFARVLTPGPPLKPLSGSQCPPDPQLRFTSWPKNNFYL